jgi:hypothetical protein
MTAHLGHSSSFLRNFVPGHTCIKFGNVRPEADLTLCIKYIMHKYDCDEPVLLCKIWGFHGGDCEEFCILGYNKPVCTSQETHYISATESSQLTLCKIWGLHGSDYEECRLLGYKNPVRTSQETHYVSSTGSSRLMLCKIWGFHGSDYEEWRLLGWYAVWLL